MQNTTIGRAALASCLLLSAVLLPVIGGCTRGGGARGAEAYLPADAAGVVAVPKLGDALAALGLIQARFTDLEPVRRAVAQGKAELLRNAELDLDHPETFAKQGLDLDQGLYYAVSSSGKDHAVVIGTTNGKALDAYLRRMAQKEGQATFGDRTVNGVAVTILSIAGKPEVAWAQVGRQLILCPKAQDGHLAEYVAQLARLDRTLAQNDSFQRAKKRLGEHHLLAYGDFAAGRRLLLEALPSVKDTLGRTSAADYQLMAAGLLLSPTETVARFYGEHTPERGKALKAVATGVGKAPPLGAYLPPDALAVMRFSANPRLFSQELLTGLSPEQKKDYFEGQQEFKRHTGMSLEQEIIPLLAGRFLLALNRPAPGALGNGLGLASIMTALPLVGMIQLTDNAKGQELLATAERLLVLKGAPVESRSEGQGKVYSVAAGGRTVVSWTLSGNLLVIAMGEQLGRTLALMAKGGPSLLGRLDQQRAKAALESADRPLFYLDFAGLTDTLRQVNTLSPSQGLDQAVMVLAKLRDLTMSAEIGEASSTSEMSLRLK